jgi:4-amino-4-deoxy-L-arabinose transferase-like glycosyltransferase
MSRGLRVATWVVVCGVVIFWRLSYLPLIDPDEAHYGQITREMRQTGDYLVPRIDGMPIIDKPALFHWLQAGAMSVFGENEFAARLPTALAALVLWWTTFWLGRRWFGEETGHRAALMLALTPLTFVLARFAIFDMLFNASLFGALALLFVSALENRPRLQIPGFLLLSLAVQIKGPFVLIVVGLMALAVSISPAGRAEMRKIRWLAGLIAAGVLALPWFLLMWNRFGQQFIDSYVLYNNVQLFSAPLYRRRFYPFFYVRVALAALFPWMIICLAVLIDRWRMRRSDRAAEPADVRRLLLWVWMAVVFVFFSASRFKLDHYIYPMAPAAALLAADAWQRAAASPGRRYRFTSWSVLAVAVLLVVIGAAGAVLFAMSLGDDLRLPAGSILMPIAIAVGGVVCAVQLLKTRLALPKQGLALFATLIVLYGGTVLIGLPVFESTRPGADLGRWLRPVVASGDRIVLYQQDRWKASLRYTVEHPVRLWQLPEELVAEWRAPGRVYGVMKETDVDVLRREGLPLYEVYAEPAIVGTSGKVVRRQIWGRVVIVTNLRP